MVETHRKLAEKAKKNRKNKKVKKHSLAAFLWAKAAEAEAKELEKTEGVWPEKHSVWKNGPSGKATKLAKKISRKLGVEPNDYV